MNAYLKRSEESAIKEYSLDGKKRHEYRKKNEDIATECLKHQRSWRTGSEVPKLEKTVEKEVLKPTGKKL